MTEPPAPATPRLPPSSTVRIGRSLTRVLLVGAVVVLAIVAAGLPLYVFPPSGVAEPSVDAVVVLGPASGDRVQLAQALVDDGRAGVLVISRDPSKVTSAPENAACTQPEVICFLPDPATTRGEAADVSVMARDHAWTTVAIVTGTPHVTRARYIFTTCATVNTEVLEAPERDRGVLGWARQYAYQSAGFLKAFVVGCVEGANRTEAAPTGSSNRFAPSMKAIPATLLRLPEWIR